jgi:acetyl-CoA acyltransferase
MHFAAQGVLSGAYDIVVAAGVESMTRVPIGSAFATFGALWSPEEVDRYQVAELPNQGIGAEMIADEYSLSRHDLDEYAATSQHRAATATPEGRFANEIVPVPVQSIGVATRDEGIREGTSVETLAGLKPAYKEDGKITAGNSSQICDGASAALIMSAAKAQELGLRARARFHSFAVAGADPITMLKAPIPATAKILARSGLSLNDIDVFEINEAFASVVLAWQHETGADLEKVNPNGGAIALGHPLGSSGTKLMATLLNELERSGGRYGLQVMCEGGGMANATIVEALA